MFSGLATILPFITDALLGVPELSVAFFALVGYLASDYAERFAVLEPQVKLGVSPKSTSEWKETESQGQAACQPKINI